MRPASGHRRIGVAVGHFQDRVSAPDAHRAATSAPWCFGHPPIAADPRGTPGRPRAGERQRGLLGNPRTCFPDSDKLRSSRLSAGDRAALRSASRGGRRCPMSYVIAAPEALVAAATDLATLGSTIGAANAAAAGSTTALLTAGADEVSAAIAAYSECTARPIRHSVRGRRRSMSGSCRPWPQVGRLCGRRGRQRLAAAERARFAECAHSGAVGASVGGQWRQWGPGDWGKRRRWRDFVRVRGGRRVRSGRHGGWQRRGRRAVRQRRSRRDRKSVV